MTRMISEEFLMMVPGSMGTLAFYTRKQISLTQSQQQKFLDVQTNELSRTFDPPPGLSPDQYSELFLQHYIKSRQSSKDQLDRASRIEIRQEVFLQVGNPECLREVESISNHEDFIRWENPQLIEQFLLNGKR